MDDRIETGDLELEVQNCKICGVVSKTPICKECMLKYYRPLKDFLEAHPGMTYLEANFHKSLPVPRNVLYEFSKTKLLKIRD